MKGTAINGCLRPRRIGGRFMVLPGNPAEDTPYSRRVLAMLATDDAVVPEICAFEVATPYGAGDLAKRLTSPLATSDDHLKTVARAEGIGIV